MSNASLNAKVAIAMVCDALAPYDFRAIQWFSDGDVCVQAASPEQRHAIADRFGLTDHRVNRDGNVAIASGVWADISVEVFCRPDDAELAAWTLANEVSA